MKKDRLLWVLIILLVIINISGLIFIISERHPRPGKEFDEVLIHELGLSNDQIKQFDVLKRDHHQRMMKLDQEMRPIFEDYFNLLTQTKDPTKKDSLEKILSARYQEKIKVTYQHFDDLKAICTPEQQEKLSNIVPFLMQVISPEKNMGPPRRK
jgi:protein CpxP